MVTRRAGAMVLATAMLAAACSDDDGSVAERRTTTTAGPTTIAATTTAAAPATTAPAPPTAPTTAPAPTASTTTTSTTTTTTTTTTTPAEALAAGECPAVPAASGLDPDRPRHRVDLAVSADLGTVTGRSVIDFTPDLPTDRLVVRLWANAPRPASAGTVATVDGVRVDGGDRAATRVDVDPTRLDLVTADGIDAGTTVTVELDWTIEVGGPVNSRTSRSAGALRLGSFVPLLPWEPGVGWAVEPPTSGFAEVASSPSAAWDVTVVVPDGVTALVPGVEVEPGRWRHDGARDLAVAVGRFETISATVEVPEPVEVVVGVHDGIADPQPFLDEVVAALADFSVRFGPYPWATYTLAITPDLRGGIEYPAFVHQGPGTLGTTNVHEVAHMWFYALVGNNQGRDPVLDEGLATYAEARFNGVESGLDRQVPRAGAGEAGRPMTFWESRLDAYFRSVYVQGARGLRDLGDLDLVDCALRHYVARHSHRIATQADLVDAMAFVFPDAPEALARIGVDPPG